MHLKNITMQLIDKVVKHDKISSIFVILIFGLFSSHICVYISIYDAMYASITVNGKELKVYA